MYFSARLRFSITLVVFALSIASFLVFVLPELQAVRNDQRSLLIVQEKLKREKEVDGAFTSLRAAVSSKAPLLARTEIALPTLTKKASVSDVPELITTIQNLADREAPGVFMRSIRIGAPEEKSASSLEKGTPVTPSTVQERSVAIEGIASYESLKNLFSAVANSLRILEPKTLNFRFDPAQNIFTFSLTMNAFVQSPPNVSLTGER